MRKLILLAASAAICLSAPALAKPGNGGGNGGQGAGNQGNGGGNGGQGSGNQGNGGGNGGQGSGNQGNGGGNGGGGQSGGSGGGGGGGGGGSGSAPVACSVNDISVAAIACSGFYAGNLLSNSSPDIAAQITGLQAIGFTWDGDFNGLVAAGNKFDANGATTLNFAEPLSGITVLGIHFGGGGPAGVGNGTAFYRFDAGTTLSAFNLAYQGSSGVVVYSTGHGQPDLPPIEQGDVPEPASWAMMIAGFGMVGAAMRRRRASVRFA